MRRHTSDRTSHVEGTDKERVNSICLPPTVGLNYTARTIGTHTSQPELEIVFAHAFVAQAVLDRKSVV